MPEHSLGVSLTRKGTTEAYEGFARDNYEDSAYATCTWSREAVRCAGTWSFSATSSSLRIERSGERLLVTIGSARGGTHTYPCLATDEDLGDCVLNPGTATCPNPPPGTSR